MVNLLQIETELLKVEKTVRRHGKWRKPAVRRLNQENESWDALTSSVADVVNGSFYIRSLPACAGMFGAVREAAPNLLLQTRKTDSEKLELARTMFNQLVSDLRSCRSSAIRRSSGSRCRVRVYSEWSIKRFFTI